jgi:hypothetical protein
MAVIPETVANGKVQMAMQYLQHLEYAMQPRQSPFGGESSEPRALTIMEDQVRGAALMCLLEFFRDSELSQFVPQPPVDPEDPPSAPVPVEV